MIDWKESGGPPVQPPSRRGFGTTIIERSVPFDLKGDAEIRFDLLGVQARFVIPANYVQMMPTIAQAPGRIEAREQDMPRISDTALIVEDNLIIAMSAEVILLELGARHVETAASVSQALGGDRAGEAELRAARHQSRRREQHQGGAHAAELNVPFIFATGYGERAPIPAELSSAPVISKPYTREVVEFRVAQAGRPQAGLIRARSSV